MDAFVRHRQFESYLTACRPAGAIINVSYRMDSTIAPDRHSASAERVDSSPVLVAKVSYGLSQVGKRELDAVTLCGRSHDARPGLRLPVPRRTVVQFPNS